MNDSICLWLMNFLMKSKNDSCKSEEQQDNSNLKKLLKDDNPNTFHEDEPMNPLDGPIWF